MTRNTIVVLVALMLALVATSSASANFLVPGSTVTGSSIDPNRFYISWGSQRWAGDGMDFDHVWFGINTPYWVNVASWCYNGPTGADPTKWSATLEVRGIEMPVTVNNWAYYSHNTVNDLMVFEAASVSRDYGYDHFNGYLDLFTPTAEVQQMDFSMTEGPDTYFDYTTHTEYLRFTADFNLQGDFLANPAPEPATLCLLTIGGGLMLVARCRKGRRKTA